MPMDFEKYAGELGRDATSPHDCVLAIAIPLSRNQLERDFFTTNKEFARLVVGKRLGAASPAEAWLNGYAHVIKNLFQVVERVRSLGVTVVTELQSNDLNRLFQDFKVVSIIAHGPFPLLRSEEILEPKKLLKLFGSATNSSDSNASPLIKRLLQFHDIRYAKSPVQLVRALNRQLEKSRRFYNCEFDGGQKADLFSVFEQAESFGALTRLILYEELAGFFKPPPILELNDGMLDFENLITAVPLSFTGKIDFVACSAVWFTESLRKRRPSCGDILCPRQLADIEEKAILYQAIINQISHYPDNFTEVSLAVHRAAIDWVKAKQVIDSREH